MVSNFKTKHNYRFQLDPRYQRVAKPLVNNFLPQLNQAPPPTFRKHGEQKRHTNILGFIAAVVIGGGGEDDGRTTKRVSNGFDCHLKTQYTLLSQCTIISEWWFGVVGILSMKKIL